MLYREQERTNIYTVPNNRNEIGERKKEKKKKKTRIHLSISVDLWPSLLRIDV